ncbi:uncharacterized protein [Amphiura filiformis]|uniref:uncharacterized protein n=1 Tax=Amphiura filiformis TaxID=82378 RepID=UPI003B223AB1
MEKPDDLFMIEMDMDMRELEADIDMNSNQMQDVKAQNGRYKKNSNVRLISQKPRGGFNTDKGLQAVLMRLQAPDDSGKGYLAPLAGDGGYGVAVMTYYRLRYHHQENDIVTRQVRPRGRGTVDAAVQKVAQMTLTIWGCLKRKTDLLRDNLSLRILVLMKPIQAAMIHRHLLNLREYEL